MRLLIIVSALLAMPVVAWALPNEVSYDIEVELLPEHNIIVGSQRVEIINLSGQSHDELYFHLYPNAFKKDAETLYQADLIRRFGETALTTLYATPNDDAFIDINLISIAGEAVDFSLDDTILRVQLPQPLSSGESVEVQIEYVYDMLQGSSADLMAFNRAMRSAHRDGVYTVTLWYPKLAVFDESGWHLSPYRLMGEFYGDYASFDVQITVPRNFEVGATGSLALEVADEETKSLLFRATDVHDFAWVASSHYQVKERLWNGVLIRSLYIDEFLNDMDELAEDSLDYFSNTFGPYAYETFTTAQVKVGGGMEYPSLVVIGQGNDTEIVHEVAHQWWYGAVGNNELEEAWLDEGFTTFAQERYFIDRRDLAPRFAQSSFAFNESGQIVLQPSPEFPSINSFAAAVYTKGSGILWMLRGYLGADQFDEMLRAYYEAFRFQNTSTEDFVSFASEHSWQDLAWYFTQWLTTTKTLDYAVQGVKTTTRADGIVEHSISIQNEGDAIMPVQIEVETIPELSTPLIIEWDGQSPSVEIVVEGVESIDSIVVDPERVLLEQNRVNNHWRASFMGSVALLSVLFLLGFIVAHRQRRLRK